MLNIVGQRHAEKILSKSEINDKLRKLRNMTRPFWILCRKLISSKLEAHTHKHIPSSKQQDRIVNEYADSWDGVSLQIIIEGDQHIDSY